MDHIKKGHGWESSGAPQQWKVTRQGKRLWSWRTIWVSFRAPRVPVDERGMIPRKIRRAMARAMWKREARWRSLQPQQGSGSPKEVLRSPGGAILSKTHPTQGML